MTTSQDWWPARLRPLRTAFHPDGLAQRGLLSHRGRTRGRRKAAPSASLRSTAGLTTANLDRARRLLWPIKQKYGSKLSWGDLMDLRRQLRAGIGWASRRAASAAVARTSGSRRRRSTGGRSTPGSGTSATAVTTSSAEPLGAVQMGLIYVNPQGPNGHPRPACLGTRYPRDLPAHGDERRGDGCADRRGGHTFGKAHGANLEQYMGREPEGASLEEQGLGWRNTYGTGKGVDSFTSGLEGAWTIDPVTWDNGFFDNLFKYDWELTTSPAGGETVDAEGILRSGDGSGRARPVQAPRPDDADDGPRPTRFMGRSPSDSTRTRISSQRRSRRPGTS